MDKIDNAKSSNGTISIDKTQDRTVGIVPRSNLVCDNPSEILSDSPASHNDGLWSLICKHRRCRGYTPRYDPAGVITRLGPGKPAGVKSDDNPAGVKSDDNPAGVKSYDNPAGVKSDDNPADVKSDDKPEGVKSDDNPAGVKSDDNPTGVKS